MPAINAQNQRGQWQPNPQWALINRTELEIANCSRAFAIVQGRINETPESQAIQPGLVSFANALATKLEELYEYLFQLEDDYYPQYFGGEPYSSIL